jgi:AcrR family transcriptional regulator
MTTDEAKARRNEGRVQRPTPQKPRSRRKGNAAGRPTLDELERRKGIVMNKATELFLREGYAGTSLVDIANSAGVATRTVYQHFGDKEAIFRSVLFARETAAVFPPPEIGEEDSLFEVMMRAAEYLCEVSFRPTTVDLMRLAIGESRRFPDMMKRLIEGSNARFEANVKHIFDELVAHRFVQDDDTAQATEMFIHLVIGNLPLLIHGSWKAPLPTPEKLEQKVNLFILGRWGPAVAKRARTSRVTRSRKTPPVPPAPVAAPAPKRRSKRA